MSAPRRYASRPMRWSDCYAAKSVGRYQTRDSLLILLLWRHGCGCQAIDLRWSTLTGTPPLRQAARKTDAIPATSQSTGGNCGCCAPSSESDGRLWIFMSGNLNDVRCGEIVQTRRGGRGFDYLSTLTCSYCLRLRHLPPKRTPAPSGLPRTQNIQYHTVRYELAPRSLRWVIETNFKTSFTDCYRCCGFETTSRAYQ